MSETFRIVLRDAKRYDAYETREFDLPLNSTFPIGRASKNATKRELLPAQHNAYIDSPVISREHAVLSANASNGTPHVYLTDSASMHGTMINGRRLAPNTPAQLSDGDNLQFGIDVNRDQEYFVARTYTFESRLSRPYSLGFAVPDAESEDEEVDMQERHGSQLNPLTIDDSDYGSDDSDKGNPDVTIVPETVVPQTQSVVTPPIPAPYQDYPESAVRSTIVQDSYSEDEGAAFLSQSENDVDEVLDVDYDSEAASIDSLDIDYNEDEPESEVEIPDSEEEEEEDVIISEVREVAAARSTTPLGEPSMSIHPAVQPRDPFSANNTTVDMAPELPPLGMFSQSFDNSFFTDGIVPPLPPRPTAPRPAPWNHPGFASFVQHNDHPSWYVDDMSNPPNYMGSNFGDRPSLFSQAPALSLQESTESRPISTGFFPSANRLQTPPPMLTSDVTTSPPVQPGRRTKVSIEEIVEEVVEEFVEEQPPTPTSVNNMKRKADEIEEEETPVVEELIVAPEAEDAERKAILAQTVTDAAAQTAAILASRPRKQPRSILSKVLNTATYPLLGVAGAAVSFTLLSTLPDTFFGA